VFNNNINDIVIHTNECMYYLGNYYDGPRRKHCNDLESSIIKYHENLMNKFLIFFQSRVNHLYIEFSVQKKVIDGPFDVSFSLP